jgi:plasmid stabilization system protein ParE
MQPCAEARINTRQAELARSLIVLSAANCKRRTKMPRGDKSSYSSKQKRQARDIEKSYEDRGVSSKTAAKRAWATVNKQTGGAPGKGGAKKSAAQKTAARKSSAKKAAQTRARRK